MIVEYIRYELKTHTPEELVAAYDLAADSLRASDECLGYDLAQCDDAPNALILRIQWASAEAHIQGFRRGPNFPPFLEAIRPFIEEIAEMRHYHETHIAWRR
jgi:quinol monooxygenase YgiN